MRWVHEGHLPKDRPVDLRVWGLEEKEWTCPINGEFVSIFTQVNRPDPDNEFTLHVDVCLPDSDKFRTFTWGTLRKGELNHGASWDEIGRRDVVLAGTRFRVWVQADLHFSKASMWSAFDHMEVFLDFHLPRISGWDDDPLEA